MLAKQHATAFKTKRPVSIRPIDWLLLLKLEHFENNMKSSVSVITVSEILQFTNNGWAIFYCSKLFANKKLKELCS